MNSHSSRFHGKQQNLIGQEFLSTLNFDENSFEFNRLTLIYRRCCEKSRTSNLTREGFRDLLSTMFDVKDENIAERLFLLIGQGEKFLSLKQFLSAINYLIFADESSRLRLIFRVYDVSADGNLQREELFAFLRQDLPMINEKEDADAILNEFLTYIFKKFDKDQDGLISYDDFYKTCQEYPTLPQCFGQVLPNNFRQRTIRFLLNGKVNMN